MSRKELLDLQYLYYFKSGSFLAGWGSDLCHLFRLGNRGDSYYGDFLLSRLMIARYLIKQYLQTSEPIYLEMWEEAVQEPEWAKKIPRLAGNAPAESAVICRSSGENLSTRHSVKPLPFSSQILQVHLSSIPAHVVRFTPLIPVGRLSIATMMTIKIT